MVNTFRFHRNSFSSRCERKNGQIVQFEKADYSSSFTSVWKAAAKHPTISTSLLTDFLYFQSTLMKRSRVSRSGPGSGRECCIALSTGYVRCISYQGRNLLNRHRALSQSTAERDKFRRRAKVTLRNQTSRRHVRLNEVFYSERTRNCHVRDVPQSPCIFLIRHVEEQLRKSKSN